MTFSSLPAEIQRVPNKPLVRLVGPSAQLVLFFASLADRELAMERVVELREASMAEAAASEARERLRSVPPPALQAEIFRLSPDLLAVHRDLVVSGAVPEADFWSLRRDEVAALAARAGGALAQRLQAMGSASAGPGGASSGSSGRTAEMQRMPLPTSMMAELGNTVSIHLTPEKVGQIFVECPEVRAAFMAKVPSEMDEKTFWNLYARESFKRLRRRKFGGGEDEDEAEDHTFAPFRRIVLARERAEARRRLAAVDPTVDLASDLADAYGTLSASAAVADEPRDQRARVAPESIARDVNRHGARVLAGPPGAGVPTVGNSLAVAQAIERLEQEDAAASSAREAKRNGASASVEGGEDAQGGFDREVFRWRADAGLDDLRAERVEPAESLTIRGDYGELAVVGERGAQAAGEVVDELNVGESAAVLHASWDARLARIDPLALDVDMDPNLASATALELSLGVGEGTVDALASILGAGQAAKALTGAGQVALSKPPTEVLPPQLLEILRQEALRVNGLLQHLWDALPPIVGGVPVRGSVVAPLEGGAAARLRTAKAQAMVAHLQEARRRLEIHLSAAPGEAERVHVAQALGPLVAAIDRAFERARIGG